MLACVIQYRERFIVSMSIDPDLNQAQTSGRKLAKATGTVAAFTLLSRVLGMVRDVVIAGRFGAGMSTDAFFVAQRVPNLLRSLMAEGSLANAFVPILAEEQRRSNDAARRAIGGVSSFVVLVTTVLAILGIYFAEEITLVFAPGFGAGTAKTALAAQLMRIMFPYIVIVSLLALAGSILNSLGRFGWSSASQVIMNLVMIGGVLFSTTSYFSDQTAIYALSISVLVGGVMALYIQQKALAKSNVSLAFRSPLKTPAIKKLCRLMLPSVLSASLYQILIFVNTLLASLLPEGSVSWLFYADRIFQFPIGVFSLAVATAALPSLSRLASEGRDTELSLQLSQALSWMLFGTLPAALGMVILAQPIMSVLFERGTFSVYDAQQSAAALAAFSIGLWSVSCQSLLVRGYLAKQNALIPSAIACLSIGVNIVLSVLLMGPLTLEHAGGLTSAVLALRSLISPEHFWPGVTIPALGHVGLALSGSIGSILSVTLLTALLPSVRIRLSFSSILSGLVKSIAGCLAMGAGLMLLMWLTNSAVTILLLGIPLGAVIYLSVTGLLRAGEALAVFNEVHHRYLRFSSASAKK